MEATVECFLHSCVKKTTTPWDITDRQAISELRVSEIKLPCIQLIRVICVWLKQSNYCEISNLLLVQDATGNITNTYFGNNSVTTNGGAIFRGTSTGNIYDCNFYGNKASSDGGAIYDSHVSVSIFFFCLFPNLPLYSFGTVDTSLKLYRVLCLSHRNLICFSHSQKITLLWCQAWGLSFPRKVGWLKFVFCRVLSQTTCLRFPAARMDPSPAFSEQCAVVPWATMTTYPQPNFPTSSQ